MRYKQKVQINAKYVPSVCLVGEAVENAKECGGYYYQYTFIDEYSRFRYKVERSHRKDNEQFYASHRFYSFDDFVKQLTVRQKQYNNFPMRPLNWKSPYDVLFSFPNV